MTLGLKGTVLENQKQSRLAPKSCGNKKRKQHRASQKNIVVKRDFSRLKRDDELCNRVREVLQQKLNGAHFSNFSDLNDLLQSIISEYIPRKERVARRQTWWENNMGEIRKLLDEQQRLRREMYHNYNGKAAFKDYKCYVQRETRRFEFNYWNQICDDIMAKANAGDSRDYAALKNMYGDQPNKADSLKAFKKAFWPTNSVP